MSVDVCEAPHCQLVCENSSFLDEENSLVSLVQQLHFNYKVSLLIPDCSSAPSHLDSVINSFSSFVLIKNMPVSEFIDKDFLETAVYPGSVCALSYRTRIGEDNCVALMPNGRLRLSLDRHSYHLLGIEGKVSKFRSKGRHIVSVDLTDSSMAPGGRGYDRLLSGLTCRLPLTSDFLLSHQQGVQSCLKSLLSRYDWSELRPEVSTKVLHQLTCPSDLGSCDAYSVMDWLGAVDAGISSSIGSSSSFLSTYTCPGPQRMATTALSISVSGFLLPHHVQILIMEVRQFLEQSSSPWASLTVHGFTDNVVSCCENEHGRLRGGVNFYTLLMSKGHDYKLLIVTGSHDSCSP
ncbi:ribonuclease P protein subunit p40 isoform X2 [Cynoglossus semilaevis]|uniref:Ribonuclease P/MRP subunit p40 n=1 Tax=Cynoglossus semilaevis TaxID=244447 RepID=A0A3P8WD20_CYNSE|nr:ribonuclease P protein subunit p40 isoform X2 [Cynoglossus semilaevis]